MLNGCNIGFIGAGSMSEAILEGLFSKGKLESGRVFMMNRTNAGRLRELAKKYGLSDNQLDPHQVHQADILILAVKPKDVPDVLEEWGSQWNKRQLLISVAAGISTALIEGGCAEKLPVIRAMPNTSCAVGLSVTAIARGTWARKEHVDAAIEIFSSIGSVYPVEETLMDAVTGLSGSGPAYIYYMVEALEAAGVQAGLQRETARALSVQTLFGAAHMLIETGKAAQDLRREVTSPGGTTMAGLEVLNQYRLNEALKQAVLRAKERSREMGEQLSVRFSTGN